MSEHDKLVEELAVANSAAMFKNLALMGALVERHLVDPAKVADWAAFFVGNGPANREHLQKVAARLPDYARQLVNIVKPLENRE